MTALGASTPYRTSWSSGSPVSHITSRLRGPSLDIDVLNADEAAALNEQRCIIRHELGYYRGLVTAAVYRLPCSNSDGGNNDPDLFKVFGPAIRACIDRHPILMATIDSPESEQPRFCRAENIDLASHLRELDVSNLGSGADGQDELVQEAIEHVLNADFDDVRRVPPWRVYIQELNDISEPECRRFLLLFNVSHSHADGKSGLIFHNTLFSTLQGATSTKSGNETTSMQRQLPPALGTLPISWPYFLRVVVKEFLPWLHAWLNSAAAGAPWTGSPMFYDESFRTAVELIRIDPPTLRTALGSWRPHGVKLTALLHIIIVRSLVKELKAFGIEPGHLISGTPVDLRKAFELSDSEMGVSATSIDFEHLAVMAGSSVSRTEIAAAQEQTRRLAHAASTRQDHAIGLLEWAKPIRGWVTGKLGKSRETSYELSNAMVFEPGLSDEGEVEIERICFAQPADAVGHPLSFNVVGLKGGGLEIAVSWQIGALGLKVADDKVEAVERQFVDHVAWTFKHEFRRLSKGPEVTN